MSSNSTETQHMHENDYIDLKPTLEIIWSKKIFISIVSTIFALVSIAVALSIPNQYISTATLTESQNQSSSLSNSISSQFGDLASFAGVNMGTAAYSESQVAFEVMQSWSFIEKFIQENNLEVNLIAVKGWDIKNNSLIINNNKFDVSTSQWLNMTPNYKGEIPSSWQLKNAFKKKVKISRDINNGTIKVSFEYFSPFLAKEYLELYIQAINDHMRDRKLLEANNNIQYLQKEIEQTSVTPMRELFYKLIEEQTKSKMIANATPNFIFNIVNEPMVPEERSRPARSLIVIAGTFSGCIFAILFIVLSNINILISKNNN
jgi:uncharacterized protein involved in exopolysaccharide biosynthesis